MKYRVNKSVTLFFDDKGVYQETLYIDNIINIRVGGSQPYILRNVKVLEIADTYIIVKQLDSKKELSIEYDDIRSVTKN